MESEWSKRKNNQVDKHAMEVDKQRAKAGEFLQQSQYLNNCIYNLETDSNTVQERLASKIQHDYELDQPIVADRGDPYALQVGI